MSRAGTISSAANPLVKDIRRAIERGAPTSGGYCIAEGFHLLDEALRSGVARQVLVSESAAAAVGARLAGQETLPLSILPDRLFQTISATETSQGVVVLVEPRQWMLDDLFRGATLVVVLDGVQDPGNAGAIVRAAEAFGATAVVFGRGSVSPFNPKTLRGSAGSLFRMPFVHGIEAAEVAAACDQRGVKRFAAMPSDDRAPRDLTGPCALIIGSEAHGVSEALRTGATPITIPTEGVESLNAAMAAGILLYEARRQRSVCP